MKLQNPFSRLRKKDFIPMSLFPCNKVTRTSMPIGRLVPLYTLEMMQNNRAKISCSQLTRFLTMSAPVMQNFEITFGAFFCPYLALDDYFVHSKSRGNSGLRSSSGCRRSYQRRWWRERWCSGRGGPADRLQRRASWKRCREEYGCRDAER